MAQGQTRGRTVSPSRTSPRFAGAGTSPTRTGPRFSRPGGPSAGTQARRPARRPSAGRRQMTTTRYGLTGGWMQRRQPPKSGPRRALDSLTGSLPGLAKAAAGGKATKKARRGGKAGGFALVTAAVGIAYKNRDKLSSMMGQGSSGEHHDHPTSAPSTPSLAVRPSSASRDAGTTTGTGTSFSTGAGTGAATPGGTTAPAAPGTDRDTDPNPADVSPVEAGTRPATNPVDPAKRGDIAPTDPGLRPDIPAPEDA
jgi:hypothetical protein